MELYASTLSKVIITFKRLFYIMASAFKGNFNQTHGTTKLRTILSGSHK